ncbi:hypothetical protein Fot_15423 [Forsythia ovata]|uniref:Uncharacterized protein n=1 Tax=Forsythia ovata TaxID=205694 RepID=A0ABD1W9M0_9LAMI
MTNCCEKGMRASGVSHPRADDGMSSWTSVSMPTDVAASVITQEISSAETIIISLLAKINKSDYKIFKREWCKHYHILGEIFNGTTATGGLGNASTQLPANSEKERQLKDDFLNGGVHVHVETLDDDVDEVPKTRRREEIGTSGNADVKNLR